MRKWAEMEAITNFVYNNGYLCGFLVQNDGILVRSARVLV